jgi:hypothetical protein
MATDIFNYCPSGDAGAIRGDLEYDLEGFFGEAASCTGGGGRVDGFNLDFELCDGQDEDSWVTRLREFLKRAGAGRRTFFDVYPKEGKPRMAWRRVEVFGADRWLTERPPKSS